MDNRASSRRKRGVALLVVVGLLALLMISSVAFVTMMRIERAGASNFRHAVSAREMVNVAVGRFLGDINGAHPVPAARINDDIYPQWTNSTWIIPGGLDAGGHENVNERETLDDIPEEIVFSINPDRDDATRAHVLSERMMDFVPGYFRRDVAKARPEWVPISVDGRVVGRYSYIALNTSGMLDINVVHSNGWSRAGGKDPAEIRIDGLDDVESADTFASKRDDIGGYKTLEQVAKLESASGLDEEELECFVPFSYIPNEDLVPKGLETVHNKGGELRNPKLYIGGDLPSRLNETYKYADGTGVTLKQRLEEILYRDDMLNKNFVGSDGVQIGSGSNMEDVPGRKERIDGYVDALLDYIDADDTPRNLNGPNVENNAMISGISFVFDFAWIAVVSGTGPNSFLQSSSKFAHEILVTVSARNPFGTGTANYSAKVTMTRTGVVPTVAIANLPSGVAPGGLTTAMVDALGETLLPDGKGYSGTVSLLGDGTTAQGDFKFAVTNSIGGSATKINRSTTRMNVALAGGYKIDVDVELYQGTVLVDKVQFKNISFMTDAFNSRLGGNRPIANPIGMRALTEQDSEWYETFDPRFNWFGALAGEASHMGTVMQWASGTSLAYFGITQPDFGGAGKWAEYIFSHKEKIGDPGEGGILRLFDGMGKREDGSTWADGIQYQVKLPAAKNAPLDSIGEMALIPIAPYYTPRLYDHRDMDRYNMVPEIGYHRFYDFFTLRDPDEDVELRGLVNPNSRQPGVMTAVYNQMPLNEWDSAPKKLETEEAREIGELVYRQLGGAAQDVSGIGKVDWLQIFLGSDSLKGKFVDEARREAVIRNAAGLFSTRQQSFLVLLRADAFSTRFGQTSIKRGSVLSTAKAVALVWRDPIPDEDGNHPCFIQMVKIITDDEDSED